MIISTPLDPTAVVKSDLFQQETSEIQIVCRAIIRCFSTFLQLGLHQLSFNFYSFKLNHTLQLFWVSCCQNCLNFASARFYLKDTTAY